MNSDKVFLDYIATGHKHAKASECSLSEEQEKAFYVSGFRKKVASIGCSTCECSDNDVWEFIVQTADLVEKAEINHSEIDGVIKAVMNYEGMKDNEFKCDECGRILEKDWTEEDALKEKEDNGWGHIDVAMMAEVCDDCYSKIISGT